MQECDVGVELLNTVRSIRHVTFTNYRQFWRGIYQQAKGRTRDWFVIYDDDFAGSSHKCNDISAEREPVSGEVTIPVRKSLTFDVRMNADRK